MAKTATLIQTVENGQVECPLQGALEVDSCLFCPALEEVDLDSDPPRLVCRVDASGAQSPNEKVAYRRLGLLRLAESLGNVSEACRRMGVTRKQYYHYKNRYQTQGFSGLIDGD